MSRRVLIFVAAVALAWGSVGAGGSAPAQEYQGTPYFYVAFDDKGGPLFVSFTRDGRVVLDPATKDTALRPSPASKGEIRVQSFLRGTTVTVFTYNPSCVNLGDQRWWCP